MKKKTIRVGCYVRVSTENQIENYSIEEQMERLGAYCIAKDWQTYQFYTDAGYSGGNTNRPALKQLIYDIDEQKIDIVAVYKLDRLSRSQKDTLTLIEDEFLSKNVDFVSMSENFDTSTPFGRAMIGILSVFAQLEKDQITERFTMGRIGRSKAGYYHGGAIAPTGYRYIDGKLMIDEYMANQVREVYARFLDGYSISSIQAYMHDKYGRWKSHTLVLNVLKNSVYIGKVKFNKMEYDGIHEPIISFQTYEETQSLLQSRTEDLKNNPSKKTPFRANHLLSGLITCGQCGARYSANHGYYKCYSRSKSDKKYIFDPFCKNDNWRIEDLDEMIISQLKGLSYNHDCVNALLNKKQTETVSMEAMTKRIKEIDLQISKIIDLYQLEIIPAEQLAKRIDALKKEKSYLLAETNKPAITHSKTHLLRIMNEGIDSMPAEEASMLVRCVIRSVIINGQTIRIIWKI